MKAVVFHDAGNNWHSGDALSQGQQWAIDAYQQFNMRQPGWLKVELTPSAAGAVH